MHGLDRLQIKNFKSIRELNLELRPLNVLIGPNGAGKSNFIGVFELLHQIVQKNLQTHVGAIGGAETVLYFGRKISDSIALTLSFTALEQYCYNGYHCTLLPTAEDRLIFDDERVAFHDTRRYTAPLWETIGKGHTETLLANTDSYVARYVLQALRSWRVYHFHDTSASARMKATSDVNDNTELRDDASNLASFLYILQQKHMDAYKKIVATVQLVAPFFDDFDLKPSRLNEDKIRLEWREKGSDTYFNAHALSDGTLRFICLATLLLMPDPPATILIDEPELGLHPYAITLLAALLRSAATRTQVIVSTQSVTLVNQFTPEDIIVVDRKDGQSTFERPNTEALATWLEEYGMGDLWEKNLLGGRPR